MSFNLYIKLKTMSITWVCSSGISLSKKCIGGGFFFIITFFTENGARFFVSFSIRTSFWFPYSPIKANSVCLGFGQFEDITLGVCEVGMCILQILVIIRIIGNKITVSCSPYMTKYIFKHLKKCQAVSALYLFADRLNRTLHRLCSEEPAE